MSHTQLTLYMLRKRVLNDSVFRSYSELAGEAMDLYIDKSEEDNNETWECDYSLLNQAVRCKEKDCDCKKYGKIIDNVGTI